MLVFYISIKYIYKSKLTHNLVLNCGNSFNYLLMHIELCLLHIHNIYLI